MSPQRPSADQFVEACHREFRYLVDEYGFTAEPLVLSGSVEPFGVRFRGPTFSVVVQGIQWGAGVDVYLETFDAHAEWRAELERQPAQGAGGEFPTTGAGSIARLDELRMRSQIPAHWLIGRRRPGWYSLGTKNQLAEIRAFAAVLRRRAGDLFGGDSTTLSKLVADYLDHHRQQALRERQETEAGIAQQLAHQAVRPRELLEQAAIVQRARASAHYLRTECGILLRTLRKNPDAGALLRFAESWRALAESLQGTAVEYAFVKRLPRFAGLVKELRSARVAVATVQAALASGQVGQAVIEKVEALGDQSRKLIRELDLAQEAFSQATLPRKWWQIWR